MDSNPHETRPLKRRRMEMAPPDGFTATASRKPVQKPVVPQFSSAFNAPASTCKSSSSDLKERRPVLSNPSIVEGANKLKERRPIQVLHAYSQYHTRSSLVPLKPAVPPIPLLVNKHSSKDLKSLQPPPVPLPSNPAIDGKILRTISKTRVALATDLSTDTGVAELASIFLHDQHPEITLPISHPDNHDGRGLGLSPAGKSKGKSSKFVRGGLAARASAVFEQSKTSLVLWQKEMERRAHTLSSSDLRVDIIRIVQKPLPSHTASRKPISPVIALCRIRRETDNTHHRSYNFDDLYRIVFSFPSCLAKSIFNDPLQFAEGRTVRICCPWQEISFTEESGASILLASLPLPSSEPTLTPDVPVNDKVFLCSRFIL